MCAVLAAACDRAPGTSQLDLGGDTVQLSRGTKVRDVRLAMKAGTAEFDPPALEVRAGDVVRFATADSWTHALVFDGMPEAARPILDAKSQLRSPPLVVQGATWIVSLEGVPAGAYRVLCTTHNNALQIAVK